MLMVMRFPHHYFTEWAWMKIEDPALAAKVLADWLDKNCPIHREIYEAMNF